MRAVMMGDRLLASTAALAACAALVSPGASPARELEARLRAAADEDPMGTMATALLLGGAIFFAAERGENPKVTSFADALYFVSTSMSVGYSDIFPRTEAGKLLSTVLAALGPALTARALADAKAPTREDDRDAALLAKLDEILVALKDRPQAP